MSASRVVLLANDPRTVSSLQAALKAAFREDAPVCAYDAVAAAYALDARGVLLLVTTDAASAEQARALVQELCLRKLAAVPVLVELGKEAVPLSAAGLEPHLPLRVRWPEEEDVLLAWLRANLGKCQPFPCLRDETLEEKINRLLRTQTPSLLPMAEALTLAAANDVTILLCGDTGSGKTHLARLIHDSSPRQRNRFMAVPCGALPASLLEGEFFGHAKGAFTGADQAKVGKFGAVGDGTLLLDEIDTLSLEHQASLLRVIETGEYEPVGSTETKKCSARIIAASNLDLVEAVEQGKFRRDLYYRLNVIFFYLPPLQERVRDIEPLARGMAARFNSKFRKNLYDIAPEAMHALQSFPWPGNIRQLENVIQQAVLISSGPELQLKHLPVLVRDFAAQAPPIHCPKVPDNSLTQKREAHEKTIIQEALEDAGFNRTRAANMLGVSRVTLYKKMKKYGLMDLPTHATRPLAPTNGRLFSVVGRTSTGG